MRLPLPLDSSRRSSPERLINCYPETKPKDAKSPVSLVRAPGITSIANLGFKGRGLAIFAGELWAVVAGRLYRVDTRSGEVVRTGTILGSDRVAMAATVDRLCILTEDAAHLADPKGNVSKITDEDFRPALDVTFSDQYLLFVEKESGRFFSSNLNAPEAYNSLNFATAESSPDNLVGLIADHGQVFLAGKDSCEIWSNTGRYAFPFERVTNETLELGCASGASLAKLDNSIFWLANDLTIRRLTGSTPVRVSNHGVEDALQGYESVVDSYAFSYTFDGHLHYVLTVPGFGTWVFDVTTGRWHERKTVGEAYWQVIDAVQFGPDVWCLHEDGRLGRMQASRYTEFGSPQVMSWTNQPIYRNGELLSVAEIELMVKTQ